MHFLQRGKQDYSKNPLEQILNPQLRNRKSIGIENLGNQRWVWFLVAHSFWRAAKCCRCSSVCKLVGVRGQERFRADSNPSACVRPLPVPVRCAICSRSFRPVLSRRPGHRPTFRVGAHQPALAYQQSSSSASNQTKSMPHCRPT